MSGSIILKMAAVVAMPLEALFLFAFSTIEWGIPTHPPPQGVIAEWGRSAALLIHLPGVAITSLIQADYSYYPILFVSGWFETGLTLAAALWLFSWSRDRLRARHRGP
jgi:hypothetical protein